MGRGFAWKPHLPTLKGRGTTEAERWCFTSSPILPSPFRRCCRSREVGLDVLERTTSCRGHCAGRNGELGPRQGALVTSLVRVLAPMCFRLLLVDTERVGGAGTRHETLLARCSSLGPGGELAREEASRERHPYRLYLAWAAQGSNYCKETGRARSGGQYANRGAEGQDDGGPPSGDRSGCAVGAAGRAVDGRRERSGKSCQGSDALAPSDVVRRSRYSPYF